MQQTMLNDDRKQERERNSKHCSFSQIYNLLRKPRHPERIDLQQFNSEQEAKVSPGIQTWPAQTECICSAAYTITTTMVRISLKLEFLPF